jgi:hypothetical protein
MDSVTHKVSSSLCEAVSFPYLVLKLQLLQVPECFSLHIVTFRVVVCQRFSAAPQAFARYGTAVAVGVFPADEVLAVTAIFLGQHISPDFASDLGQIPKVH